jgi:hypothetical protein
MSRCRVEREVLGSTAWYRLNGNFEGSCAFDLARHLEQEPLSEVVLDFSRVAGFVDYGVAVMSSALLSMPHKAIHLRGLRHHQLRLFKYFGVEPDDLLRRAVLAPKASREPAAVTSKEVA